MSDSPIGVIGLGKMGLPMAEHLKNHGFSVVACERSPALSRVAEERGIAIAESPATLAEIASCILVVVGNDQQVLDVCCSEDDGILSKANERNVIFLCSTVSPETAKQVGSAGKARAVPVLDATLCGGEAGAVQGSLLVMGGGEEHVFDEWRPVFDSFATATVHLGPLGAGQIGKLVNNLLVWVSVVGNYEALRLGMKLGLGQEKLRNALLQSSGNNPLMHTWRRARPMPWAEDDMAIVLERADNLRLAMPLAGVVRELIKDIKVRKAEWGADPENTESMFDFVEWVENRDR